MIMEKDQFFDVGKVDEVPVGKMKHVEVQGKEIVISNIGGKFYAMDDRCGHMNATTAFSHEGMHVVYEVNGPQFAQAIFI